MLNLSLFKTDFFTFLFSIYQMVDIMDMHKSLNISIETLKKNPEILKFVPNHLKTKKSVSMKLKSYLFYKDISKGLIKLFYKMVGN